MLRLKVLVSALLLLTPALLAQEVPAGTVMPVMLQTTLNAKKARIGQRIQARVMQDVPLSPETRIRAGTKLIGHIVAVTRPGKTSGSRIVFTFDRLIIRGVGVPVTTSLRSLASMMDVFDAQLPTTAIDDRGTSQSDWVTTQIGGDAVYRGAGIVMSHGEVVGKSTDSGEVTAKLIASREGGCRGAMVENERAQALWLFSPSACGAYGFEDLKISHAGRNDPIGQIVLESDRNVNVSAGSGLLLRVTTPPEHSSVGPPQANAEVSGSSVLAAKLPESVDAPASDRRRERPTSPSS